ncbi:MAG: undecaprenyl/decaprenyl-phosphate alpha-N-acetylglucosaminyl 1-phosphate transferase [Prevotellaceae bacterium]|nr:undecaprenyl/decaprenyl-phosphate alpha-N-acetylglucosaminyl 1-phosphate transferase [Candidatus Faecinaster equi]
MTIFAYNYFVMSAFVLALAICLLSFVTAQLAYPFVLGFARKHNIVDCPNFRKLQKTPVAVMGGVAVYIGILISLVLLGIITDSRIVWVSIAILSVLLMVGLWDDIRDISVTVRFLTEFLAVWSLFYFGHCGITSMHGLWNREFFNPMFAIPFSLFAGVGIINAINMIDGIDGYCSGFSIFSSSLFAALFFYVDDVTMGCVALSVAGAMLPFFLHNVFGQNSKMFLGDAGTLMIGSLITLFVFHALAYESSCSFLSDDNVCIVAFVSAICSIPVCDTLRVMTLRVKNGESPFHADRNHMHHLFLEMNFSHIGTTVTLLTLDFLVVMAWFVSFILGASLEIQMYVVIFLGFGFTFGLYQWLRFEQKKGENSRLYRFICRMGMKTRREDDLGWKLVQKAVDSRALGGKKHSTSIDAES